MRRPSISATGGSSLGVPNASAKWPSSSKNAAPLPPTNAPLPLAVVVMTAFDAICDKLGIAVAIGDAPSANMAAALLEYETIDTDEVQLLVQGGSMDEMKKLREAKLASIERDRRIVNEANEATAREAAKTGTGQSDPVTA